MRNYTRGMVVGIFGMDLYEIYWWFAAGMAIALTEIGDVAARRGRLLEERLCEPASTPVLGVA